MKNNLIFTGLGFQRDEATKLKVCDFICKELGISDPIQFGNVHIFGKRDRTRHWPIVARFIARRDLELVLKNSYRLKGMNYGIKEQFPEEIKDGV